MRLAWCMASCGRCPLLSWIHATMTGLERERVAAVILRLTLWSADTVWSRLWHTAPLPNATTHRADASTQHCSALHGRHCCRIVFHVDTLAASAVGSCMQCILCKQFCYRKDTLILNQTALWCRALLHSSCVTGGLMVPRVGKRKVAKGEIKSWSICGWKTPIDDCRYFTYNSRQQKF